MRLQTGNRRLDLAVQLRAICTALDDLIEEAQYGCTAATQAQLGQALLALEEVDIELEES